MTAPLLDIRGLSAGYGTGLVVRDLDLRVDASTVLGVVGRNGMGKTTLLQTLMGMIRPSAGTVLLRGKCISGLASHSIWAAGLALVPQGRRVFAGLTVAENLDIVSARPGRWARDDVYTLFPRLGERRKVAAGQLSGGEQQMLAIGRALLGNPDLLLLDEPCEGLAPTIVREVGRVLGELRDNGQSIMLVEQNLDLVLDISSKVIVMEKGIVTPWTSSTDLEVDRASLRRAIGVTEAAA